MDNPITAARTRVGISQRQLAEAAGVHYNTVSRIERGRHRASVDTLERLAIALDVPVAALIGGGR